MKKIIFTLSFILAAYILKAQSLYGTTMRGGKNNGGTICKLAVATNTLTAAFSFDAEDGYSPGYLKLLEASNGKLYGMTPFGGSYGAGTIFSYDPVALAYTQLKSFDNVGGAEPWGGLIQASDGKLYGMATGGIGGDNGFIFSYDPVTSIYTKLKNFDYTNGANPYGSLVQAADGKLYGMTLYGGSLGYGVIFSYDPVTSAYTKLKDFNKTNGAHPQGSLLQASDGKLYGMTSQGGFINYGVIFSYNPADSAYMVLYELYGDNGSFPSGDLVQASDGKLYGMTSKGGNNDAGVIFSFDPRNSLFLRLKDFDNTDGAYPYGNLIQVTGGDLYGMTSSGGSSGYGVIFSFDPVTSAYTKLKDFDDTNGGSPHGSLTQATDGKLYGTSGGGSARYGVIFSYDPAVSTYTKLRDFCTNNTGNSVNGALIKGQANKMYGMAYSGGSYGAGTIFSYDANTSVFTKLNDFVNINGAHPAGSFVQVPDGKLYGMTSFGGSNGYGVIFSYDPVTSIYKKLVDFDYTNGANPYGSLIQASDGKIYGMTISGGDNDAGVIFSYDPATSAYTKVKDFDRTQGGYPNGTLAQASDGKLYGMTSYGGNNDYGVIFSYDPATLVYTKLVDFDGINGMYPSGSLVQSSDGKLYGMTRQGGSTDHGVIFSYDPATLAYTRLIDFDHINGAYPSGDLMQASDKKLYGMTSNGGSNDYGVAFSYDAATSIYTKLNDFNGDNGNLPQYTYFTEIPAGEIQISIADKSVMEGNQDRKFIAIPVILSEKSEKIIRFNYITRNNTAKAGSDYIAQSGKLVFPPGFKKIILHMLIKGDKTPEANETFSIILSDPVNATIGDSAAIVTISDDDASAVNPSKATAQTMSAINLSPNPAQGIVKIMLTGYTGNVVIQLSGLDGRMLQQQHLNTASSKPLQQQLNVSTYANGIYLVTVIDEKGNRKTERLVIKR